ncbi:MAG: HypC/HybG/HupF family hydrogenase formation chaperone [Candidatus Moranbacteria bacterium]|nr:HypC/HybG/HupF family hydrogenase formation chaperone [Candidatus Moranbacteria bacterium]
MCLTLPKKVIEIKENSVVVENHDGNRQELKTLIELAVGDFVISQQNIILEKLEEDEAMEIISLLDKNH